MVGSLDLIPAGERENERSRVVIAAEVLGEVKLRKIGQGVVGKMKRVTRTIRLAAVSLLRAFRARSTISASDSIEVIPSETQIMYPQSRPKLYSLSAAGN